ncbi:MAG: Crp/Fnr family transcriptional regulator [Betaproteobacteria bacterium]|nr:Crp/Fnr family transcriptional regulator [Betaproteobacteria bacterium]
MSGARKIKIQAFLGNLPLFNDLAVEELDRIARGTCEQHLERGRMLYRKGDASIGLYCVVYGQVKLSSTSAQGDEKVVEIIGPGSSFGEAVMFMEKPHILYAQALTDSLLLQVSRAAIFEEIDRDPAFARKLLAGLSRRLHSLVSDVEWYSLRSGVQRVIGFLLRQPLEIEADGQAYRLTLPTSKNVVASRLSLTPEHFSRILHELSESGLIAVDGREVELFDVEKLRAHQS